MLCLLRVTHAIKRSWRTKGAFGTPIAVGPLTPSGSCGDSAPTLVAMAGLAWGGRRRLPHGPTPAEAASNAGEIAAAPF